MESFWRALETDYVADFTFLGLVHEGFGTNTSLYVWTVSIMAWNNQQMLRL